MLPIYEIGKLYKLLFLLYLNQINLTVLPAGAGIEKHG